MGNASDTSDVFASTISKEHDILIGSLYSVFCKFTQQANFCCIDPLVSWIWKTQLNLSFFPLQVYCPSWATAFCFLLHITSGRPWSQRSSSSSISPLVTLGWRSLYSHWQYHQLFHTGISYSPRIYFISPILISLWQSYWQESETSLIMSSDKHSLLPVCQLCELSAFLFHIIVIRISFGFGLLLN